MKKEKIEQVDVHDDDLLVFLGIRPENLKPRDPDVWTKSRKEKKELKRERRIHRREDFYFHTLRSKSTPVKLKLIISLKKNDIFPNTTYSTICDLNAIRNVLYQYRTPSGESLVNNYKYNGKKYENGEFPYWYWQ